MLRFVILSLFFLHVSSKSLWTWEEEPKLFFNNVTLEKDTPINLPINEDRVKLQELTGTLYSDSLSLLKVRDLDLQFWHLEIIEPGALCSSSSLKRLRFYFLTKNNFTISKDMVKNCENLEELELIARYNKHPVEANITENLPKLTNLNLVNIKIDYLRRNFFKNLPLLESLTISGCFFETIDYDAFEDLKNLKDLELLNMPEMAKNLEFYFGKLKLDKLKITNHNDTLSLDWLANMSVTEVLVKYKYLDWIEEGAICSSSSIKRFELYYVDNEVTLPKEVFKNCQNLENLVITGNNQLDAEIFKNLPRLKSLELRDFEIPHITRTLFKDLGNLELLRFHRIYFDRIDEDAFEDLKNLTFLDISYNKGLTHIPEKLFGKLARLETLWLSSNYINNVTWDEFKGLSSLKKLNIKHNWVETLNADKIATNMPSLNEFNYANNANNCDEEEVFAEKLQAKLGHPVRAVCKEDSLLWPPFGFGDW